MIRSRLATVLVTAGMVALTACGGNTPDPGAEDDETTTEPTAVATTPVERTVDKTGWYAGFAVTVDTVTATPDGTGGANLEIGLDYQNLSAESATPSTAATLEVDGEAVQLTFDSPSIPGEGASDGTATAYVPADSEDDEAEEQDLDALLDGMQLVYGEAADNQTKIPFAEDAEVESVEPRDVDITATLGSPVVAEIESGSLQPSYQSGERDVFELRIQMKFSCASGCSASGYNIGHTSFSLTSPDDESVNPDDRSPWCCDAIYPATVVQGEDAVLVFLIDAPATGTYTFTFVQPADDEEVTVEIEL